MSIQDAHNTVANVIGHFVMAFGDLEIAAGGAIMRLLKQDERVGSVFVAVLSFGKKLEVLRELDFKIENSGLRAKFLELLTQITDINAARNRFIHAEYRTMKAGGDDYAMVVSRLRDAHKYDFQEAVQANHKYIQFVDVDAVGELANDAAGLAHDLLTLSEQFNPGGA
jgi:phosphoglucomutase